MFHRLVVGGGRRHGFPKLKWTDVSLSLDPGSRPHVLGDANRAPFTTESFLEVLFERVPYDEFTGKKSSALHEAYRVLQAGGRLVIETGRLAPRDELRQKLHQLGFQYVRMTEKGFLRVTGRKRRKP